MNRSAIVWATIKAVILAYAVWLAVALLFGGISEFGARVFEDAEWERWVSIRHAFRFWTAWWFLIFGVISAPLWVGLFAYFIRRFALPGFRLAAVGYLLAFQGLFGIPMVLAYYLDGNTAVTRADALLSLAVSIGMLFVGLFLANRFGKAS